VREKVLVPAIGKHCEEWNFREKLWFLGEKNSWIGVALRRPLVIKREALYYQILSKESKLGELEPYPLIHIV